MTSNFYISLSRIESWYFFKEVGSCLCSNGARLRVDVVDTNKKRFFNHSADAVSSNSQIFCIWETKEGINLEEFEEFVNGPTSA